jgi:hypothetical protein
VSRSAVRNIGTKPVLPAVEAERRLRSRGCTVLGNDDVHFARDQRAPPGYLAVVADADGCADCVLHAGALPGHGKKRPRGASTRASQRHGGPVSGTLGRPNPRPVSRPRQVRGCGSLPPAARPGQMARLRAPGKRRGFCRLRRATVYAAQVRQAVRQLEKLACLPTPCGLRETGGRFSDINSAAASKRRGFCRLRRATVYAAQVRQASSDNIAALFRRRLRPEARGCGSPACPHVPGSRGPHARS